VQKYVFLQRNTKTADYSLNKKRLFMRKVLIPFLLLGFVFHLSAQPVRDIMKEPIPVAMFQATYAFEIPGLDTKDLYGVSHDLGGGFVYKTESNWLFTLNANYIYGTKVKGDRVEILGEGITTDAGEIIGNGGNFSLLELNQRGFHLQGEVGKLFPYGPNPNSGFFVQGGLGYLRNRIRIDYQQSLLNPPLQLDGDYRYGYDRMRGGPAAHLETGYLLLNDSRLLNVSIALEVTYARTRDLRDYDFRVFTNPETGELEQVGYTDPNKRYNDLYYGIRVTWNIPTYERKPQDFYYD
jgi:hypothetical protein